MLDPDVRRVLDGTSIAHLATVLPDGSPHTTPVFVGAYGDRIVFFTGPSSLKARNLRRDPRMALSIAPADNPFQPIVIRGVCPAASAGPRTGPRPGPRLPGRTARSAPPTASGMTVVGKANPDEEVLRIDLPNSVQFSFCGSAVRAGHQ